MKCYYEVLEVPKDADEAEIKTAYRKMALKWHPDKNLDNSELAKEQFQIVQQAYEVLSDRQERAWYDKHREQILRGSNSEFEDNCLDVYQYFTTTCFQGYNDEEKGFYTIYRKVFEEIAKEDLEFMEDKDEFCEIPGFGTSNSDYESIVKPFYDYWMSYSTKKSYSWLDPMDIREGRGNRRVMKYIEKENKKIRLQAKTQRNEEIRNLVSFVRKRDKRVQAYKKVLETKSAENRKKQEELRKQKKLEQQRLNDNQVEAEWAKFDNVQSELKEIEKHLAEQFGEEISNSEESESDDEDFNNLYCIACNKVFKNPKAFQNHEFSKKHKENVEYLKEVMQEEEKGSNLSDVIEEFEDVDDINEDLNNLGEENGIKSESESLASEESNTEVDNRNSKQKKKNKRKNKNVLRNEHEDEKIESPQENITEIDPDRSESDSESINSTKKTKRKSKKSKFVTLNDTESNPDGEIDINISDDNFDFGMTKKQKKKNNKKVNTIKIIKGENTVANGEINEQEDKTKAENVPDNNKLSKKAMKKSKIPKKDITPEDLQEIDISHCCVTCKSNFPSKNKLFDHLKKTGHGVYLPSQKARQTAKKKGVAKE